MSYRDIKNFDNLFSKTNRNDRYKQMSKQQQLIEEKKRQIQEKLELQKRRDAEEALKKLSPPEPNSERKQLVFNNDGSFLDQFKKLSGVTATQECGENNRNKTKEIIEDVKQERTEYFYDSDQKPDEEKQDSFSEKSDTGSSQHHGPRPPPPLPPDPQRQNGSQQQSFRLHGSIPQPIPPQMTPQQAPHYIPYTLPPPPPVMPPLMPQNIPPPLVPQSIPPPGPMNVQSIPPPPLTIPPPPLPPCFPPPQYSVTPSHHPIPNLLLPPPSYNSIQVPAENVQGKVQIECYSPTSQLPDEKDSKEWFHQLPDNNSANNIPLSTSENIKTEIKQENTSDKKGQRSERKRKSRWGDENNVKPFPEILSTVPKIHITGMSGHMLSKVTRTEPGLLQYALTAYGSTNLSDEDWKKAEENYKVHLLYQDMMAKRAALEKLQEAGKNKYEYDSDEEIDEKGTWEHKLREKEMVATQEWAESLTEMAKGKHHIGDFLPPDELKKFLAKYQAMKGGGGEPDLSDYKEYKLGEDNKGFQMLQKLGWSEGQGLGTGGTGRLDPINKGQMREFNEGLGLSRPDDVSTGDDEYDAYRKRMMLAYRFRPNPLNNPRRPYY